MSGMTLPAAALPAVVLAHAGSHLDVLPELAVAVVVVELYARGVQRIRARAGRRVVTTGGVWCFLGGMALLQVALIGPVDDLDTVLFSVHMTQHVLLGLLAPLFIVLGRPVVVISWGFGDARRRRFERLRRRVLPASHFRRSALWVGAAAVAAHVGSWWLWHIPAAFDATLVDPLLHDSEHLTLFATGLALWWVSVGVRWRERAGLVIVELLIASMGTGMLAALLVFEDHPVYSVSPRLSQYGISAMSDQALGGAIMWVPGGIIYLTVATVVFIRWLQSGPARNPAAELDPAYGVPELPSRAAGSARARPARRVRARSWQPQGPRLRRRRPAR